MCVSPNCVKTKDEYDFKKHISELIKEHRESNVKFDEMINTMLLLHNSMQKGKS